MKLYRLHPSNKYQEIFVFGSNLRGIHGAGAALHAWKFEGAVTGVGEGLQGTSYAIPTKDYMIMPRKLPDIQKSVETFLEFAFDNMGCYTFFVTPIGCGLAGFRPSQIAPMFRAATKNVHLPEEFLLWLNH